MPPLPLIRPAGPAYARDPAQRTEMLRQKSQELEAAFLAEMLSFAGLGGSPGKSEDSFSGGIGEQQFASFLRQEQAKLMVQHGGIGLAEQIFRSLTELPE